jgi:hypothetical protein
MRAQPLVVLAALDVAALDVAATMTAATMLAPALGRIGTV